MSNSRPIQLIADDVAFQICHKFISRRSKGHSVTFSSQMTEKLRSFFESPVDFPSTSQDSRLGLTHIPKALSVLINGSEQTLEDHDRKQVLELVQILGKRKHYVVVLSDGLGTHLLRDELAGNKNYRYETSTKFISVLSIVT